jgi:hypothetical protein
MHVGRSRVITAPTRWDAVIALLALVLLVTGFYLVSTLGMQALRSSDTDTTTGPGVLPTLVYKAPDTVPTTADYGPVGPIAMVFAGTDVRTGLTGEQENPWIAISSHTGDYRALSAPHLPEATADGIAVSADGETLAWGYADGLVVYDAVQDEAREVGADLGAEPVVGSFSPDGSQLTVYDGQMHALGVDDGEVVATLSGLSEEAADQAVWTPDGASLTYVEGDQLVTHAWTSDERSEAPSTISADATLAWQPSGDQIAAMQETRGVNRVEVFDIAPDGRLTPAFTVHPRGYAQQELIGYIRDTDVAVTALRLETGSIEVLYEMSTVDDSAPSELVQLPGPGINWAGTETMEVPAGPMAWGSTDYDEPRWPWSDVSKLIASAVVSIFLVGVYITRPRRRR